MSAPKPHEAVIRRRRLTAAIGAAAVLVVLAILVVSVSSGTAGEPAASAQQMPSAAARAWARDSEARREARIDQEALDAALTKTRVLRHGGGRKRLVALTFDDGPGSYTPQILDILDRFEVPATFFVIGGLHDAYGALIKEEIARGHVVANHTVGHPSLADLTAREQAEEIDDQSRAIELFGGTPPKLLRPPYNAWDETTVELAERRGMLMVLWSVETGDWEKPGADVIVKHTLDAVEPGSIVLMHDGGGDRTQTVQALPRLIRGLRADGYRLVTVPRMLREDPPVGDQSG